MSSSPQSMRMAGGLLRMAARLIETPGTSFALFRIGAKQLGLGRLQGTQIPEQAAPYRPVHLVRPCAPLPGEDRQ